MKRLPSMGRVRSGRGRRGFTLIELLVAMAIAVLLMMTAVPYFRTARKTPLVRAANDLVEACRQARIKAILSGQPMQVVIHDGGAAIGVEPVPGMNSTVRIQSDAAEVSPAAVGQGGNGAVFEARLDDEVAFRRPLLINGRDFFDSPDQAAAIRFFPNGTSDSLQAELKWLENDIWTITLDVMTGQPFVEGRR